MALDCFFVFLSGGLFLFLFGALVLWGFGASWFGLVVAGLGYLLKIILFSCFPVGVFKKFDKKLKILRFFLSFGIFPGRVNHGGLQEDPRPAGVKHIYKTL